MQLEQARDFLRALPHVTETMQWGANLVYWAADKAIGGKMFALIDLDEAERPGAVRPVLSFYAGPEKVAALLEKEGCRPAPYLARAHWVAMDDWGVFTTPELQSLLREAHQGVFERLPARTTRILALAPAARRKAIAEARALREQAKVEEGVAEPPARAKRSRKKPD